MKAEFDQFAKDYREDHNKNLSITGHTTDYFAKYKAKKLFEWVNLISQKSPSSVLDFGCGDGLMTKYVKSYFADSKVFGIDPSVESIKIAEKNYSNITFKVSNSDLSFFESNSFDLIFTAAVFHHIPFEEHNHYIKQLIKILKKEGILIIFEHNPFNPITQYLFNTCPLDINATMMAPKYTKQLVKKYGNTTTKFYGFFPKFLERLQFFENYLERIPVGALYAIILKKS